MKVWRKLKNDLSIQVLKRFRVIYGSVRQHYREIEQACGILGTQLWILQEVSKTPGIGISSLAERLFVHQSTASQLVEKLVARGLLIKERSKEDQRRVGLQVTEEALRMLNASQGSSKGVLLGALLSLTEPSLAELDKLLIEVVGRMQTSDKKYAEKPLSDL